MAENIIGAPSSGASILKGVIQGGADFNEVSRAINDSKKANEIELQTKGQIVNEAEELKEEVDIEEGTETNLPGSGSILKGVVGVDDKTRPTAEQFYTKDKIKSDIEKRAAAAAGLAPSLAIERLSVEEYYPNIRKDIAVGTYSGKMIGSATIFAAPAARLPYGLYNERKRAIADAALKKQQTLDKIFEIDDAPAQYDAKFKESYLEGLEPLLEKYNYDGDAFLRSVEGRRYMAKYNSKALEMSKAVEYAESMITSFKDEKSYIPDEMMQTALQIRDASIDNLDDIIDDKENMVNLMKGAQVYFNLTPIVNAEADKMLAQGNLSQMPLNLKTGGEFESEKFIAEREEFFVKLKSGTLGTDQYASGVVKFFGGKFSDFVDGLIEAQQGNPEQAEALKKMFAARIQKSTILSYENVKNDNLRQQELNFRKAQFEYKKEQDDYFGQINEGLTNAVYKPTGLTLDQELAAAGRLTGTARQNKMAQIMGTYFNSPTKDSQGRIIDRVNIPNVATESQVTAESTKGSTIRAEYWDKKDNQWKEYSYTPEQFIASNNEIRVDGRVVSKTDREMWNLTPTGTVYTRDLEVEIRKGHVDNQGVFQTLRADGSNLDAYNASKNKKVYAVRVQQAVVRTIKTVGNEKVEKIDPLPGRLYAVPVDISSDDGQMIMNAKSAGYTGKQAGDIGGGETFRGSSAADSEF